MARFIGARLERLDFRLVDILDDSGTSVRLKIAYGDLAKMQSKIVSDRTIQDIFKNLGDARRALLFLAKSVRLSSPPGSDAGLLWRALFLIHVAHLKVKEERIPAKTTLIFMAQRPWLNQIKEYAAAMEIQISPIAREYLFPKPKEIWRRMRVLLPARFSFRMVALFGRLRGRGIKPSRRLEIMEHSGSSGPKLAVEYYGHLNLDHPECKSDLFFWQRSNLNAHDIIVAFGIPSDPLDADKLSEIKKHDLLAVALSPQSTIIGGVPVFSPRKGESSRLCRLKTVNRANGAEIRFLREELARYDLLYGFWHEFFERYNVRLYTSWYKYDEANCALADAMQDLGGITTLYQRAFEEFPSPDTSVAVDVLFGFSALGAEIERRQGSDISFYVITGYNGDHRYALLRQTSKVVREKLQRAGARRILAFFDENSLDDARWQRGHEFMRTNYRFLLQMILSDQTIGLVLKPKTPATLRRRLGDVAELLQQAEATGRCFIWEDGVLQGTYPPAVAALSADVAIHGHLSAATAGMEAALAGVPTLLLDREGWSPSRLYQLGLGRVVFSDWAELSSALAEHWRRPGGIPGFGDWSKMLDEIDPFRDGRAAERLGMYLQWLLDGLKAGQSRETVMADAAERYARKWGQNKVIELGHSSGLVRTS